MGPAPEINRAFLQQFCELKDNGSGLHKPFSAGRYSYSSNGFICIRVERLRDVERPAPKQLDLSAIPFTATAKGHWLGIPRIDMPPTTACHVCLGSGKVKTCAECNGEGRLTLNSGHSLYEVECNTCGGDGYRPGGEEQCPACRGAGSVFEELFAPVEVHGHLFTAEAIDLVGLINQVQIFIPEQFDERRMYPLRFPVGTGVVMGRLKEGER